MNKTILIVAIVYSFISCGTPNDKTKNKFLGSWIGRGYKCYSMQDYLEEPIYIYSNNDTIYAQKISGDKCVTSGEITWKTKSSDFKNNKKEIEVLAQIGSVNYPNKSFINATLKIQNIDTLILIDNENELNSVTFTREK